MSKNIKLYLRGASSLVLALVMLFSVIPFDVSALDSIITINSDSSFYDSYDITVADGLTTHTVKGWRDTAGNSYTSALVPGRETVFDTFSYTSTSTYSSTKYFLDFYLSYCTSNPYNVAGSTILAEAFDISSFIGDVISSCSISFNYNFSITSGVSFRYYEYYVCCFDADGNFLSCLRSGQIYSNDFVAVGDNEYSGAFTSDFTLPEGTAYICPGLHINFYSVDPGSSVTFNATGFDITISSYYANYKSFIYNSSGSDSLFSAKDVSPFTLDVTDTGATFTFEDGTTSAFTYSGDKIFLGFSLSPGGELVLSPGDSYSVGAEVSLYCVEGEPPDLPTYSSSFEGDYFTVSCGESLAFAFDQVSANGDLSYLWLVYDSEGTFISTYTTDEPCFNFGVGRIGEFTLTCQITNTLNGHSQTVITDPWYVSVEYPELDDFRSTYSFYELVTLKQVSDDGVLYVAPIDCSNAYSVFEGGYDIQRDFIIYRIGSGYYFYYPVTITTDPIYYVNVDTFPLGRCSYGFNAIEADNIVNGVTVTFDFHFWQGAAYSEAPEGETLPADDVYLTLYWYDDSFSLVGTSSYACDAVETYNDYQVSLEWNRPAGATYFTFSVSEDDLISYDCWPLEISDVSISVMFPSSVAGDEKLDNIQSSIDNIISGGSSGAALDNAGTQIEQSGEELGNVIDDYNTSSDSITAMPDDYQDVLTGYIDSVADSDVGNYMPWNDPEYEEFWHSVLMAPLLCSISVAMALYFVFGKARSGG